MAGNSSAHLVFVNDVYSNGDAYNGEATLMQDPNSPGSFIPVKHGFGVYTFANGSTYEGEWHNGLMHGRGTFQEPAIRSAAGEARSEMMIPGDRYEGSWAAGRRTRGLYRFASGDMYLGSFLDNRKHGRGVVFEDGGLVEVLYDNDVLKRKLPFVEVPIRAPPSSTSTAEDPYETSRQHRSARHRGTSVGDDTFLAALNELKKQRKLPPGRPKEKKK